MTEHDSRGPRRRGRHLARRSRDQQPETPALQWQQSPTVIAHTGAIPVIDDASTRILRLRAIRDALAAPDPA